ncbi:MAG: carboxypeptidase-like regulatory domain-containing protein [Gemmatimonadaceae bacterium]|nr:carboxypeptidase-like regulatory domain-containing protein [Gemmatimonadaceae bacterium]
MLAAPALAAQGTIRGVVTDSLLLRGPLPDAQVVLQGAPHTATTDRLGRFTMRDVPAGTYRIGFFHPSLDSLEVTAPVRTITVADDRITDVALGTPTANALSRVLCGRDLERAAGVAFGIVRDAETETPLAGAVVRANWFVWQLVGGVGREAQRVEMDTTGADGRYELCNIPNDIALTLTAESAGQVTGDLSLALDHLDLGRRDLLVSLGDTAARRAPPLSSADTAPWMRPPGSARLRVEVQTAQGRPVRGATVGVRGTRAAGTTGDDGVVRLVGVPGGSQTVLVRRPGSEPVIAMAAARPGAETVLTLRIGRDLQQLPTVAVTGQRTTALEREIRTRLQLYNGRVFEGREVERVASGSLAGWMKVPGLRVIEDGFDALPVMQNSRMQPCQPNLWYNGALISSWTAWELRTFLIGAKRMEVYPRPANQPPQFLTTNDCGSIAVWG